MILASEAVAAVSYAEYCIFSMLVLVFSVDWYMFFVAHIFASMFYKLLILCLVLVQPVLWLTLAIQSHKP